MSIPLKVYQKIRTETEIIFLDLEAFYCFLVICVHVVVASVVLFPLQIMWLEHWCIIVEGKNEVEPDTCLKLKLIIKRETGTPSTESDIIYY